MCKGIHVLVKEDEKETEIRLDKISEEQQASIIENAFQKFGIDMSFLGLDGKVFAGLNGDFKHKDGNREIIIKTEGLQENKPKSVVKKTTKQVSKKEEQDPIYFKTGIKYKDGIAMYKCRYKCECGSEANHYIPVETKTVNCYECENHMIVEPATSYGAPTGKGNSEIYRDEYGNFFLAGENTRAIKTMFDKEYAESEKESKENTAS